MLSFLQNLSAILFYTLGSTMFVAVWVLRNGMGSISSEWWMRIVDLPLLMIGMLYGGLSVYQSLRAKDHPIHPFIFFLGLPLIALFLFFVILNFWGSAS